MTVQEGEMHSTKVYCIYDIDLGLMNLLKSWMPTQDQVLLQSIMNEVSDHKVSPSPERLQATHACQGRYVTFFQWVTTDKLALLQQKTHYPPLGK